MDALTLELLSGQYTRASACYLVVFFFCHDLFACILHSFVCFSIELCRFQERAKQRDATKARESMCDVRVLFFIACEVYDENVVCGVCACVRTCCCRGCGGGCVETMCESLHVFALV